MGNPCGFGNCRETECEKCPCFSPTIFNIRVPKWIAVIGYRLEWLLNKKR